MLDLGTVKPGSTIYIPVNTFDSNDPSASVTATTWLNTDCHVHKDGGTTQRASSAGETLSIDFDTIAGNHLLQIDLADNTTANFYEAGSVYHVRIEGVTVDGGNINAWIAQWRIGYPGAILDTTIATLASQTSFTLEEGPADDDALNGCVAVVHDLASAVQIAIGYVSDYTGSTKTVTLAADPGIFTMAAGDNFSVFPPGNVQAVAGTAQTAGDLAALVTTVDTVVDGIQTDLDNGTDGLGAIKGDTAAILTDTGTTLDNHLTDIKGTGFVKDTHSLVDIEAFVDLIDDGTSGLAKIATDTAAVLVDTADMQPKLGTPTDFGSGTSTLAANLQDMADNGTAAFDRATDSLQAIRDHVADGANLTEAGGTGDHLTAINLPNQTMDIVGDITGNLSGSVGSVTGAVGSVTAEVSADVTKISGSAAAADNLEESTEAIITGTAQTGTLSTTVMTTDLTGYADDELIGRTVIWKSGTANGQASDITDYASASGTVTYTAITTAPVNGDLFVIV